MLTPRNEAFAFRIWQIAEPLGWDIRMGEVAEQLGDTKQRVTRIVYMKQWQTRCRAAHRDVDVIHYRTDDQGRTL